MNELEETRKQLKMTQVEAAKALNISRRSYQAYENKELIAEKYDELVEALKDVLILDEEHGYLSLKKIKDTIKEVAPKYPFIHAVFLFGSYARNEAYSDSDIDLLVVDDPVGFEFGDFYLELKEKLIKEIDIVSYRQVDDPEFLKRLLTEGIKLYSCVNNFKKTM